MDVMKASTLKMDFFKKTSFAIPLIFINPSARTLRKLFEAGYQEISLNRELAAKLMELSIEKRSMFVLEEARKIIGQKQSGVIIRDFEMLFDPAYHLDVVKMFCELARQFQIAVIWCGTYHDNILEFAEPGYPDYHCYHIDHYTIYCIN